MNHGLTVELSLQAPREVRHSLEARYAGSIERSLLDDVTLLASEMVTNAVQHSGRPDGDLLTFESSVVDGVLRVEITDEGRGVPRLEPRAIAPPSGLGYLEILSDRWSSHLNHSFHVWFEIDVASRMTVYRRVVAA